MRSIPFLLIRFMEGGLKPLTYFAGFPLQLEHRSDGRNRGDGDRPKKKGRGGGGSWAIDPLDPTGKTGGKWSDGLVQV